MIPVGVVGARGFVGGELLRYLLQHPHLHVAYVTSDTQAGAPVAASFPSLHGLTNLTFSQFDAEEAAASAELLFFALPDGQAMQHSPAVLAAGKKVVDISGDFRVRDRATYEQWYRREHVSPHLLPEAVYGLPELHPEVREARLVANPGCYPVAMLLALAPLVSRGLARPGGVVVDAKSGVSGAGARVGMSEEYSFPAINENFRAYGMTGHRHIAEVEQELAHLQPGGNEWRITFTPHLLPITRGILATCYVDLTEDVNAPALTALYREFYARAPFVHVQDAPPEVHHTAGTNRCILSVTVDARTRRAICLSAIDNLGKGAAGQAVHNANLMLGLEETAGLTGGALWP
ncbi:MAG: N-acetyl-gamma-glutamyl-phosphate reductase [Armatimonadetes bacterium]|nr:N-acetyl-gamma-glutamyl-phosphate reductase [Armatimonadota bacterium]